jgi:di/tricarboxylate transporter
MIAIGFAYLIGAFILGLTPSDLIAMWTTKLFFILFTLTTFYGFATTNGTLEKAAAKSIYLFRNLPYLIPLIVFLSSMMLGAIGAGVYAVIAFMVPIVMPVCTKTGMNRVLSILAVITGSTVGDNIPLIGTPPSRWVCPAILLWEKRASCWWPISCSKAGELARMT